MSTRRPSAYTQSLQEAQRRVEAEQPKKQENSNPEKQESSISENQQTNNPENQGNGKPEKQKNRHTVKQGTRKTLKESDRIKATFYIDPEDILTIDEIQMQRFRDTGKKPLKSDVVSEALKLLRRQTIKTE